jgi:acetyl esterase
MIATTARACTLALGVLAACLRPNIVAAQSSPAPAEPQPFRYREADGAALMAYVFKPSTPAAERRPAVILLHGGGWVAGEAEWTFASARRYAEMGFVAIALQYRLSNERITPVDAFADVCGAFRWARAEAATLGIDPLRIAASGVSAGGHLAAAAATIGCGNNGGAYGVGGPDALVLWSPAVDVSGDGHFRRILRDRGTVAQYSPVEHVRPSMPPIHIVQGDRDTLTPLSGARRFCERVQAGKGVCELQVYPGVGHLLTRNLAHQEGDFDPDPVARDDGNARQRAFLERLWLAPAAAQSPAPRRREFSLPATKARGLPLADAVMVGDTLYISGRGGVDLATMKVPADIKDEVKLMMEDYKTILALAGMTMDDLVSVTIYSPDLSLYGAFNDIYRTYFTKGFPARAFIGSGPLLFGMRFEMQAIAVKR